LYQSWNYGIQQATQPWLYISTVGDSISADLLLHLFALGEAANADVVLSRPHYLFDPGHEGRPIRWAIHDIVKIASPLQDFLLSETAAHFFALLHAHTSALLGSSASNLYRTAVLQQQPLPVEYGTAGDSAWALLHALKTRIACTAREGSTFRIHAKSYATEDYHVDQLHDRLQALGLESYRNAPQPNQLTPLNIPEILALSEKSALQYAEIKRQRQPCSMWFLRPAIWSARCASKRTLRLLENRRSGAYAHIRRSHITPIKLGAGTIQALTR
jgi:hypothetical protein